MKHTELANINRILIYKRTHRNDPSMSGCFGNRNCMGRIRDYSFDAVIGVGSEKPWRDSKTMAGKLTWIGIGPTKRKDFDERGDRVTLVTFDHFWLDNANGPLFRGIAPMLAKRFFGKHPPRYTILRRNVSYENFDGDVFEEALGILRLKNGAPRSSSPQGEFKPERIAKRRC